VVAEEVSEVGGFAGVAEVYGGEDWRCAGLEYKISEDYDKRFNKCLSITYNTHNYYHLYPRQRRILWENSEWKYVFERNLNYL
jgi:hypothetical protein